MNAKRPSGRPRTVTYVENQGTRLRNQLCPNCARWVAVTCDDLPGALRGVCVRCARAAGVNVTYWRRRERLRRAALRSTDTQSPAVPSTHS